jgi:mono/diheme cytochrome c family protein
MWYYFSRSLIQEIHNMKKHSAFLIIIMLTLLLASCFGPRRSNQNPSGANGGNNNGGSSQVTSVTGSEATVSLTDVNKGLRVWLQSGCTSCHKIGDDPGGTSGPELTSIGERMAVGQLLSYIRNPQSVNPNAQMPAQTLSDEDLQYLARYLSILSSNRPEPGEKPF